MGEVVRAAARAKINLNLHVVGRRDDGYHELDTLVTFAEFGDVVTARSNPEGPPLGIELAGPFADALMDAAPSPADNIVVKASAGLRTLAERQGIACPPVHITVEKNLPVAAGLGGGSADAAAAIAALSRLWSLPGDLPDRHMLPRLLGADVAMCLASRPLRATGVGEVLAEVPMPAFPLVLVNPRVVVLTKDVFAHEALGHSGSQAAPGDDLIEHLAATRNDLEPPARMLAPEIDGVLDTIGRTKGCRLARMSGSGATCFGIYATPAEAEAAAAAIAEAKPGWWCVATRSVGA